MMQGTHPHYPIVSIVSVINELDKKWSLLIEKLRSDFVEAQKRYKSYISLINFFEKEMLSI